MRVHVLLADKGTNNPAAGTLNLLNLGWGATQTDGQLTPPHAVAVFMEAELSECNRPLVVQLELVDEDGRVVDLPGPAGPQPMRMAQNVTIAAPPGQPTGTPGKANLLLEIQPGLPLGQGTYKWRVKVGGKDDDDWSVTFFVAAPQQPPTFGETSLPGVD